MMATATALTSTGHALLAGWLFGDDPRSVAAMADALEEHTQPVRSGVPTAEEIETARAKLAARREMEARTPRIPLATYDYRPTCEGCGLAAARFRHYGRFLCGHCVDAGR